MGYMVYIMRFSLIYTEAGMCWRVHDIFRPGSHRVGEVKGDAKESDAKESGGVDRQKSGEVDRQKTGRRGNDVADSARGVRTEDGVRMGEGDCQELEVG